MAMELPSQSAKRLFKQPSNFALAVIKQFRANQGFLLAGAVAYYTLLSLVPLLILILLALSHVVDEERLLVTLRRSLEFVVPSQADAVVGELRNFVTHRQVIGSVLLVTMLFFSALAFTVLENALSVIFFRRVKIKRRHFLISAVMPYVFIVFLGLGLLVTTVVSGVFQFIGTQNITFFGQPRSLGPLAGLLIYLTGVAGEILLLSSIYLVMPVGRLSLRHALIGGVTAAVLWEISRHILRLVLHIHVANSGGLRVAYDFDCGAAQFRDWSSGFSRRRSSYRRVRTHRPRAHCRGTTADANGDSTTIRHL
jgi:membrane protein